MVFPDAPEPEKENEKTDAERYFVKTKIGVWTARIPLGENWSLYRDDPIVARFLVASYGMPVAAWFFVWTLLLGSSLHLAVVNPDFRLVASAVALISAAVPWIAVGILEAAFVQIEHGAERGKIAPPTAARKEFLKITTRRMSVAANMTAFAVTSVVASFLENWPHAVA